MPLYFHPQQNQMDCGPTCLYMISRYYGRVIALQKLRELSEIGKEGVSLLGISDAAEKIGLQTTALKLSFTKLIEEAPKPAILHWGQNHFIILLPQKKLSSITTNTKILPLPIHPKELLQSTKNCSYKNGSAIKMIKVSQRVLHCY